MEKSPINKTLRIRGLHPLVYTLNTQMQMLPTDGRQSSEYFENISGPAHINVNPVGGSQPGTFGNPSSTNGFSPLVPSGATYDLNGNSWKYSIPVSMFTGRKTGLGWLDTLQFLGQNDADLKHSTANIAMLPKCFMGLLMLPRLTFVVSI